MAESNQLASEVHVMPTFGHGGSDQLIITLEKRDGRWYHFVGAKMVREATIIEQLLPLAPGRWMELAQAEGWFKR